MEAMADLDGVDFEANEKVLELMHNVVRADAPGWYMCPEFKILFADEDRNNLNSISDSCQLELAETLLPVLNDNKPPPFSFFKGLPKPISRLWACYAVAMEKAG